MNYKKIEKEDYQTFIPWFVNKAWSKPPAENIFSDHGMAIYFGDKPAACLWLYLNGSGMAFFDWIAANPELDSADQNRAILNLIEYVQRSVCPNIEPKINLLFCDLADIELVQDMKRLGFYSKRGLIQMRWIREEEKSETPST